jgi:hypothetical protein
MKINWVWIWLKTHFKIFSWTMRNLIKIIYIWITWKMKAQFTHLFLRKIKILLLQKIAVAISQIIFLKIINWILPNSKKKLSIIKNQTLKLRVLEITLFPWGTKIELLIQLKLFSKIGIFKKMKHLPTKKFKKTSKIRKKKIIKAFIKPFYKAKTQIQGLLKKRLK